MTKPPGAHAGTWGIKSEDLTFVLSHFLLLKLPLLVESFEIPSRSSNSVPGHVPSVPKFKLVTKTRS